MAIYNDTAACTMRSDQHSATKYATGRFASLVIGAVAAALIGTIAFDVSSMAAGDPSGINLPDLRPILPAASPAATAHMTDAETIERVLARPLFSSNRRPAKQDGAPVASLAQPLPRLTGVVVSPVGRFALFASADGARPLVMSEGDHVGATVIEAIAAGEVTVRGPDGAMVLRASFGENVVQVVRRRNSAGRAKIAFRQVPFSAAPQPLQTD